MEIKSVRSLLLQRIGHTHNRNKYKDKIFLKSIHIHTFICTNTHAYAKFYNVL